MVETDDASIFHDTVCAPWYLKLKCCVSAPAAVRRALHSICVDASPMWLRDDSRGLSHGSPPGLLVHVSPKPLAGTYMPNSSEACYQTRVRHGREQKDHTRTYQRALDTPKPATRLAIVPMRHLMVEARRGGITRSPSWASVTTNPPAPRPPGPLSPSPASQKFWLQLLTLASAVHHGRFRCHETLAVM